MWRCRFITACRKWACSLIWSNSSVIKVSRSGPPLDGIISYPHHTKNSTHVWSVSGIWVWSWVVAVIHCGDHFNPKARNARWMLVLFWWTMESWKLIGWFGSCGQEASVWLWLLVKLMMFWCCCTDFRWCSSLIKPESPPLSPSLYLSENNFLLCPSVTRHKSAERHVTVILSGLPAVQSPSDNDSAAGRFHNKSLRDTFPSKLWINCDQ